MLRTILLLGAIVALPVGAVAQQPTQQQGTATANFAGVLAQNLSQALAEADALRAQVAELQRQLSEAKGTKPAEAPKPP